MLFVTIGSFIHSDSPMSPPLILWMNCLMDTIAATILASEVPASKQIVLEEFNEDSYKSILDQTSPYNSNKDPIFTTSMKLNVVSASIYQQLVLVYIYYDGKSFWTLDLNREDAGPWNWHTAKMFGEDF